MAKHIALIGMMGAGKSRVAPVLATALKRPVIEVDQLIEQQEGMPIGEIFLAKGEAYFRKVECAFILHIIQSPPAVLSLGGGAFMWEDTRNLLLEKTAVFYLTASVDILCSRLQAETAKRPLLSTPGIDLKQTVKDLIDRREANYSMAHYHIDTDNHSPEAVAQSILQQREAYE